MKYVIIWTLILHQKWNALNRNERKKLQNEHLPEILKKYSSSISLRTIDTEGFTAEFQDFVIIETENLSDYYCMLQDMRNTRVFSEGYLNISKVFMGIENAHEVYNDD
ncbi:MULTISPECIES: darcynin family protein [Xenorhabdus]|uniref:Darcynin n=1 Tax=Xenorhabdus kozodoii TaxID=351676 RepID=A0A2D0LFZ7_9GAMM|nr:MULTISPECIES: darcynin family protein [Xenorhabdus]MBC8945923.1 darcynin [Xenorhabdus indica]PHM68033.1 darcynin [Xenorhabdus sp. KJ12.1]PHM74571.1 darcynin [Xenorhabdus kozodoii]